MFVARIGIVGAGENVRLGHQMEVVIHFVIKIEI